MINFVRRTSAPDKSNKYYIRKASGGYSPCIIGKPNADGNKSALANCVGYAWGRVAEYLDNPLIKIGYQNMAGTHPVDAHHWYKYANNCGFMTGSTPKVGAVACWRNALNTSGHVAVVEKVLENGQVIVSESSYKGYIWAEHTLGKSMYKKGLIFQGFIYPTEEYLQPQEDAILRVGDKVQTIGTGKASATGSGATAKAGLIRYIYKIYNGKPYPYRVGYMNGSTTGYYKATALKKI